MSELHYPGAMELAMAKATRERKKPVPFPTETESKMIQPVSRAEKSEARVAELEAQQECDIESIHAIQEEKDRYRAALSEMSDELSHYPEGNGIFGHLKRILRRALA